MFGVHVDGGASTRVEVGRQPPCDLCDLNSVSQPSAEEVGLTWCDDLGLALQAPECAGVDEPVVVTCEWWPHILAFFGRPALRLRDLRPPEALPVLLVVPVRAAIGRGPICHRRAPHAGRASGCGRVAVHLALGLAQYLGRGLVDVITHDVLGGIAWFEAKVLEIQLAL